MWKWLVILGLLFVGLIPLPVLAFIPPSSADVVITATGVVVASPGGFTVTYVSDSEIGLSWTLATGAINTMVRAAPGRMPADRTDGYLVYYGAGTYVSDFRDIAISLPMYYRAWSQRADGAWEAVGTTGEGNFMSQSFLLIGTLFFLAILLAFTIFNFIKKQWLFSLLGFLLWFVFVIFEYQHSAVRWDIYYALAGLGAIMSFLSLIFIFMWVWGNQGEEEEELEQEDYVTRIANHRKRIDEAVRKMRGEY